MRTEKYMDEEIVIKRGVSGLIKNRKRDRQIMLVREVPGSGFKVRGGKEMEDR